MIRQYLPAASDLYGRRFKLNIKIAEIDINYPPGLAGLSCNFPPFHLRMETDSFFSECEMLTKVHKSNNNSCNEPLGFIMQCCICSVGQLC
jgi:hypothetical protein